MLGGKELALACESVAEVQPGVRCMTGTAVCTPPAGQRLAELYQKIVHTVPPFYKQYAQADAEELLVRCYLAAFGEVWGPSHGTGTGRRLLEGWFVAGPEDEAAKKPWACATPLLGAGTRGAPLETAVRAAASASAMWIEEGSARDTAARTAPGAEPEHQIPSETGSVLLFGIPHHHVADKLAAALDGVFGCKAAEVLEIEGQRGG